jgi:hypothetical protein
MDFLHRLEKAGFAVEIFRMSPDEEIVYGLLPMEWLYVATRPQARNE